MQESESVRLEKRLKTVKVIEGVLFILGSLLTIPSLIAIGVDFFVDVPSDIFSLVAYVAALGFMLIVASSAFNSLVTSELEKKFYAEYIARELNAQEKDYV